MKNPTFIPQENPHDNNVSLTDQKLSNEAFKKHFKSLPEDALTGKLLEDRISLDHDKRILEKVRSEIRLLSYEGRLDADDEKFFQALKTLETKLTTYINARLKVIAAAKYDINKEGQLVITRNESTELKNDQELKKIIDSCDVLSNEAIEASENFKAKFPEQSLFLTPDENEAIWTSNNRDN